MAALSPEKLGLGKKIEVLFSVVFAFLRRSWLAETPPAMTTDLVSGKSDKARFSFSSRISQAVSSKEAAKSATCPDVRWLARSCEG